MHKYSEQFQFHGLTTGSSSACYSVTMDAEGNAYGVGRFEDTIDFDPVPGEQLRISLSERAYNYYMIKLNNQGDLDWVYTCGGNSDEIDWAKGIALDPEGNCYMTASFTGKVDFDPGSGEAIIQSNGGSDIYLLKLNPNGEFVWVNTYGLESTDWGYSVSCDTTGRIVLGGHYTDKTYLSGDTIYSMGGRDPFLIRVDTSGQFLDLFRYGGPYIDHIYDVVSSPSGDKIYVSGYFNEDTDFDPGPDSFIVSTNSNTIGYILYLGPALTSTIETPNSEQLVQFWPNPCSGIFNLRFNAHPTEPVSIRVFDLNGKLVAQQQHAYSSEIRIELNTAPGIYLVEARSGKQR